MILYVVIPNLMRDLHPLTQVGDTTPGRDMTELIKHYNSTPFLDSFGQFYI